VRVVAADRRLFVLAVANGLAAFCYATFSTLYMLFVVRTLRFAPGVLGMIFAVGGVSSFFSSLGAPRFIARFGEGRALAGGLVLQGISWICVPAASGATPLAASLLIAQQAFGDAGGTVAIITGSAIPQTLVPGQLLGRVRATISFVAIASLITGSIVAGPPKDKEGTMIDSLPVMAWRCRPDGFVGFFYRRWLEYTGLSLDQALGWG
jgi:MFS family permease